MNLADFDDFSGELKQLCAVLGKSYNDPMAKGYWRALKDVEFREVKANVDRILRAANKETKFPRPCDLQDNAPSIPQTAHGDALFDHAVERCRRNWEERLRADPEMTRIELAIARTDVIVARDFEGSIIYAQALAENRQYRAQLQALRDRRRQAAPA